MQVFPAPSSSNHYSGQQESPGYGNNYSPGAPSPSPGNYNNAQSPQEQGFHSGTQRREDRERQQRELERQDMATDDEEGARQVARRAGRVKGVSICEEENVVFDYREEDGSMVESETHSMDDYTARVST